MDNIRPTLVWMCYDHSMITPMLELAKTRRVLGVLNPHDGPGKKPDIVFQSIPARPNLLVLGYIDLLHWENSTAIPKTLAQIRKEERKWLEYYNITRFFYDDVTELNMKTMGFMTGSTINPGCSVRQSLIPPTIQACEFEDPPSKRPKSWAKSRAKFRIVFVDGIEEALVREQEALNTGCEFLGFEDLSKWHNGEFQQPMPWWQQLK